MIVLILFLFLLALFGAATAIGMLIVLRERMAIEDRLTRYCQRA